MLTYTKDKLIIEMQHPLPVAYVNDLKAAIIFAVQHMEIGKHSDLDALKETNYTLLELLKELGE